MDVDSTGVRASSGRRSTASDVMTRGVLSVAPDATFAGPAATIGARAARTMRQQGLDYVSPSPFRVPAARLEAGRAALDTP